MPILNLHGRAFFFFFFKKNLVRKSATNANLICRCAPKHSQKVNLLVLLEVSEANKRQLVAHERSGWREGLGVAFVILYVVKVAGVDVTAQLWHDWSHRWRGETRYHGGGGPGGETAVLLYKETRSCRYLNLKCTSKKPTFPGYLW